MVYIAPSFKDTESVVFRIKNTDGVIRSLFMSDQYAKKFLEQYPDPKQFSCYEMYIILTGFQNEIQKKIPMYQFFRNVNGQL